MDIDYGGTLPSLVNLEDPAYPEQQSREASTLTLTEDQIMVTPSTPPLLSQLSVTSALNPYFGYPVSTYGRRRKRDLAKTLATLFWMRWRTHITIVTCLTIMVFVARVVFRKGVLRFPKGIARWYMLLPKRRLSSKWHLNFSALLRHDELPWIRASSVIHSWTSKAANIDK